MLRFVLSFPFCFLFVFVDEILFQSWYKHVSLDQNQRKTEENQRTNYIIIEYIKNEVKKEKRKKNKSNERKVTSATSRFAGPDAIE